MPLTSSQEKYLKDKKIGKGAATSGAIGGAAKGAMAGTSVMPGIGTAVGAGVGLLSGLFGGKSKAKKEQAAARAQLEQANANFNVGEDKRLATFGAGQGILSSLAGRGFTNIDPATAASLGTRREMNPELAGLYNPETGSVSGAISDLGNTAMDLASQYGVNKQDAGDAGGGFMSGLGISPGQPIGGLQGGFQDVMNSGNLGTGRDAGLGAVNLDDLKNLYKLGGSGTQDFG